MSKCHIVGNLMHWLNYHILRSTLTLPVFTFLYILVPLVGLVCVCVEFPDRNHVGFLYFKKNPSKDHVELCHLLVII